MTEELTSLTWNEADSHLNQKYLDKPVHIALEMSALDKEWDTFVHIYTKNPKVLYQHIFNFSENFKAKVSVDN